MKNFDFDENDSYFFETNQNGTHMREEGIVSKVERFSEKCESFGKGAVLLSYDYINTIEKLKVRNGTFPSSLFLIPEDNENNYENNDSRLKTYEISDISYPDKDKYIAMVKAAKEKIGEGEAFQIVLSHSIKFKLKGSKFSLFQKMRERNVSLYNFYMKVGEFTLFGTSPEKLVSIDGSRIITNPIAGTERIMGGSKSMHLLQSEKDLAEHNMLVDLARNDVGRVSEPGSVKVSEYLNVREYRGIWHLVSTVEGTVLPNLSKKKAVDSIFPAGTVSGAPKIRAMEIIDELEEEARGPYAGSVGFINVGHWDFAINIRSVHCVGDICYAQAGAGIVYDSIPEMEYEETVNKLKSYIGGLVI